MRSLVFFLFTVITVLGCSSGDHPPVADATVIPPSTEWDDGFHPIPAPGFETVSFTKQPIFGCSQPSGRHYIQFPAVVKLVNSPTGWCAPVYYNAEPVEWDIGPGAAAPRRADGKGSCYWSTGLNWASVDSCQASRQFVCSYMAGPMTYDATYFADDTNWQSARIQLHVVAAANSVVPVPCAKLLTSNFPTAG